MKTNFFVRDMTKISSEKPNKGMQLKGKLTEWISETTIHGFRNSVKTTHLPTKILWAACILVSVAFCVYLIVKNFIQYLQFATTSKIDIVYDSYMELPMVSICLSNFFLNKNFIPHASSYLSNRTNRTISGVNDVTSVYDLSDHTQYWAYFIQMYELKQIISSPVFSYSHKKSFGFNLSQIFVIYSMSMVNCDTNRYIWYFDLNYGW